MQFSLISTLLIDSHRFYITPFSTPYFTISLILSFVHGLKGLTFDASCKLQHRTVFCSATTSILRSTLFLVISLWFFQLWATLSRSAHSMNDFSFAYSSTRLYKTRAKLYDHSRTKIPYLGRFSFILAFFSAILCPVLLPLPLSVDAQ